MRRPWRRWHTRCFARMLIDAGSYLASSHSLAPDEQLQVFNRTSEGQWTSSENISASLERVYLYFACSQ
jgi:hypothetical protein